LIKNVRPDRYLLQIEGPGLSPRCKEIEVTPRTAEIPATSMVATGRLKGQINKSEGRGGGLTFPLKTDPGAE
jgi:hypothetical protein